MAISPTELTTSLTDVALALECVIVILALCVAVPRVAGRTALWCGIFGLMMLSSVLGALAHGLPLSPASRNLLWMPLYLTLGVMMALVAVAAWFDWSGPAALRWSPFSVMAGVVFYGLTEVFRGDFIVFVLYEGAVMVGALVLYLLMAVRGHRRGAGWVTLGIALNLGAAAAQASPVAVTLIVPFDNNGVFHLLQLVATAVLGWGVGRGMQADAMRAER
ncbi:MAG TPA: hypothetical protein VFM34_04575 [Moraxellaceae bacterium]|nr:hypothetical protein [Moraxellaceae bacterium]